jgi:4-hydroxy-tetrahydrodipicolinate reductase
MKRIILSGCNGRMGQVLQTSIKANDELVVVAGIDHNPQQNADFPVYATAKDVQEEADVIIDFSHYTAVPQLIEFAVTKKLPVVVATTGLEEDTKNLLKEASEKIPVFYSANMSLGINVLAKALQAITPALESDFNIEIIEKHHNQKKDAPSGTALLLADAINDVCEPKKDYIFARKSTVKL